MSYQGQTWVDEVALPHLKNTGELAIMLRVANHAGNGPKKMSGCFAGAPLLAKECIMSLRSAQGHLRELTRRGLLIPGDPKLVDHIRPDKRPPVYDLAAAHQPGCPGGHDVDGECTPAAAGSKICHPWDGEENRRSAGSKICHPSSDGAATGSKKRPERVAKSATKSSKELKESSLSVEGAPLEDVPTASDEVREGEREPATQKTNDNPADAAAGAFGGTTDTDKVVDAYVMARMTKTGLPPNREAIRVVREAAAGLLTVGRSVDSLCTLAAELAANGWTDLAQHALKNPEAAKPAGSRAWCGECNDGLQPMSAAQRMVQTDTGMAKCQCHPGYVPSQNVRA
ncbi:hypothetical protein AB0454_35620 [Streptomyces sp. NPDC093509]|uniref:hypothetical protein n=1 Tax=Streptomyces sp. NPDC093509 TaxID=3154982 RepID=UPI00344C14F2